MIKPAIIYLFLFNIAYFPTSTLIAQNSSANIEQLIERGAFLPALEKVNQTLKPTKLDTLQAHLYFLKARVHNGLIERDSAVFYFKKAIELLNQIEGKHEHKIALIECYLGNTIHPNDGIPLIEKSLAYFENQEASPNTEIAYAHYALARSAARMGQLKKSLTMIEDAIEHYPTQQGNTILLGTIYSLKGYLNWRLNDFIQGLEFLKASEEIFVELGGNTSDYLGGTYINLGGCSDDMSNIQQAIQYYEKALPILKAQNEEHLLLRSVYNNLGNSYFKLGEYELTVQYTQAAIDCNPNHSRVGVYINNLARAYKEIDEQKGIEQFYLAIEKLTPQKDRIPQELARPYHNLATIFRNNGDYNQAISYEKKALELRQQKWGSEHLDVARSFTELSQFYQEKGDINAALSYVDSALYIQRNMIPDGIHHELSTAHLVKAAHFYDLKKYSVTQTHIDSALIASGYDGTSIENIELPVQFMEALTYQAHTHQEQYKIQKNPKQLELAQQAYQLATKALSHWRTTFIEEDSKSSLSQKHYPLFEGAIQNAIYRYQDQQEVSALSDAFDYLEQSKALVLLEALQKTEALQFAGLPDSLLQKEKDVKLQITVAEKQAKNLADASEDEKTAKRQQIFDLKRQYESLKQQLETDFPNYYQLKNEVGTINLSTVQKQLLNSEQALLEYFVGDENIFIFLVEKDDLKVHTLPKNFPLATWIKQMREGLYAYHMTANSNDESLYKTYSDRYVTAAYQLYEKLVAPFQEQLPEQVIIVPDGILGYLPFDALLVEQPEQSHTFRTHAYLLKQHQISYSYSTTLLHEMQQKKQDAAKNWLAFAPSFQASPPIANNNNQTAEAIQSNLSTVRSGLSPLDYNIPEVEAIQNLLNGDIYTGTAATKDRFIQTAHQYRMLHLSTHGKANDEQGDYSFLAFTEDDGAQASDLIDNAKLYVRDLYNLKLNADMVVLSACETGIGELQRGEGIISLARGFSYAGAKSIITTLWSVDDKNTKDMMLSFYQHIKEGMSKDAALRMAKLDFIANHPHREAHPFFWAGFVPIGDMTAVSAGIAWWGYLMGVLVLMGIVFYFFNSKIIRTVDH